MANGVQVFAIIVALVTALVNMYTTLNSNRTIDKLSDSVTHQSNILSDKWDALNERFEDSQKHLGRLIDMLGRQLGK